MIKRCPQFSYPMSASSGSPVKSFRVICSMNEWLQFINYKCISVLITCPLEGAEDGSSRASKATSAASTAPPSSSAGFKLLANPNQDAIFLDCVDFDNDYDLDMWLSMVEDGDVDVQKKMNNNNNKKR